ncbi:MAG: hypothetical protein PHC34_04475 [Candidatus Gastranaerophilales bacterium]|nr:hypothetical protein [Candidatus Gastranaerophilales bacterium]
MSIKSLSILFYIIIFSLFWQAKIAFADMDLSVIPTGPAIRTGNTTIQNIKLNLKTKHNWQLLVTPLNNSFINISHPTSQIPVSQAEIQDNDSAKTFQLEFGKPIIIASGNNNDKIDKNCTIRISTPDGYYSGTYTGTLQFTLTSSHGTSVQNFNISFDQPLVQNISILPDNVNINILPEDSSQMNYSQESSPPSKIYIRSNKEWKLVLNSQNNANPLNYYFKVLSSSNNSNLYYSEYTQLSNTSFILAEGCPTISSDNKNIEPTIIQINYKLSTDKYSVLPAGGYPYNVIYNLTSR